ncbi:MAG: trypsin-like serine protease [Bacillota bacterium]
MDLTTTPISKGSSGGPLVNMRGEVIGVNTLTHITGQNLNFAVPVDLIRRLLETAGSGVTVAEVFAGGRQSGGHYVAEPGESAVILQWEGNADLDLEIWSEDFGFLGTAAG